MAVLATIQDVGPLAHMQPGVHTMSNELLLQIPRNIYFELILMMTSGQNISHYTTAKLSVHVWNHDLIWWQNKNDTQKHFPKTTITSSWTLSKTKIPITIIKAQMPSNPNQKSRTRDNGGPITRMTLHGVTKPQRVKIWRSNDQFDISAWRLWEVIFFYILLCYTCPGVYDPDREPTRLHVSPCATATVCWPMQ